MNDVMKCCCYAAFISLQTSAIDIVADSVVGALHGCVIAVGASGGACARASRSLCHAHTHLVTRTEIHTRLRILHVVTDDKVIYNIL